MKEENSIYRKTEYRHTGNHNVIRKEDAKVRKDIMEDETKTQFNVSYKKKNIRVLLEFTEEQGNENAEEFYSRLKKYYMEKLKIIL
ncbi:MAG: hypothetical protein HFJ07_17855 [Lachnospiraceae bacterium]|nr:hypothetical protein [Lachnospiraceae bacterium]